MDYFSALAQRISVSVREVRSCLILSRDGLVLGADPREAEALAKAAWLRLVTLGEPEKSFVAFADQVWAYVKRGHYAAFAVAEADCRPGILVAQLEQVLLIAEEGRTRRETLRVPEARSAPPGTPRTSRHPPADRPQIEVAGAPAPPQGQSHWRRQPNAEPTDASATASAETPHPDGSAPGEPPPAPETAGEGEVSAPESIASNLGKEPQRLMSSPGRPSEEETEVDRVLLAKEFSGLLQRDSGDDEAHLRT